MSGTNLSLAFSIFCFVIVALANGAFSPPQFGSFQFIHFGGKNVDFGAKNVGTSNSFQAQVPKLAVAPTVAVAAPVQSSKTGSFEAKTAKSGSFEAKTAKSGSFEAKTAKRASFEAKTAKSGSFEAAIYKPRVPSATCPTCSDQVRFLYKCKAA
jgi:hypothetical protein